jgi:hypothetical protein
MQHSTGRAGVQRPKGTRSDAEIHFVFSTCRERETTDPRESRSTRDDRTGHPLQTPRRFLSEFNAYMWARFPYLIYFRIF